MIGVTGPIGAGKSTVTGMLGDLGATVLDADAIVRDLQRPGQPGHAEVVSIFGSGILQANGELDRPRLAQEIFNDRNKLRRLESGIHPLVVSRVLATQSSLSPDRVLVVEAIKLLQSKIRDRYDEIWVVVAPLETLLSRLRVRGVSLEEAERRLANQPSEEIFRAAADVVISNSGDEHALRAQVERQWGRLMPRTAGTGWA